MMSSTFSRAAGALGARVYGSFPYRGVVRTVPCTVPGCPLTQASRPPGLVAVRGGDKVNFCVGLRASEARLPSASRGASSPGHTRGVPGARAGPALSHLTVSCSLHLRLPLHPRRGEGSRDGAPVGSARTSAPLWAFCSPRPLPKPLVKSVSLSPCCHLPHPRDVVSMDLNLQINLGKPSPLRWRPVPSGPTAWPRAHGHRNSSGWATASPSLDATPCTHSFSLMFYLCIYP